MSWSNQLLTAGYCAVLQVPNTEIATRHRALSSTYPAPPPPHTHTPVRPSSSVLYKGSSVRSFSQPTLRFSRRNCSVSSHYVQPSQRRDKRHAIWPAVKSLYVTHVTILHRGPSFSPSLHSSIHSSFPLHRDHDVSFILPMSSSSQLTRENISKSDDFLCSCSKRRCHNT